MPKLARQTSAHCLRLIQIAIVPLLLGALAGTARAATWYLGTFNDSSPADDADCGTGKGAHPAPHPCASLAYWTEKRAPFIAAGDVVRLTGTFGPAASGQHCIITHADVTYEGRTADDEQPVSFDDAVIDASETLPYPCHGGAINCRGDSACAGFSRFTLRYLTLANANGLGGEGNQLMPGNAVQTGLTIDHVRFTGSQSNGLIIGSGVANEDNPCDGVRNVHDVTIRDSQFDHNTLAVSQAGLWLTCTDGGRILRATAFDNRGAERTRAECNEDHESEGCDGRNGFHFGGWINGVIADSSAHDNGYYNYDFSGNGPSTLCDAPTHHLLVDGCTSYDAPSAHYSYSHCNHDITMRNSFAWGHGLAVNQYACAYRLRFYNNTFWSPRAVQLFANCRECDFRNNIFRCDADTECVYIDFASRNALTTWSNNVVVNEGTGPALAAFDSNGECVGTPGGSCDCPGSSFAVCPNSDPQSPGCPAPWKNNDSRRFGNDALAAFVDDAMFGDETGSGDRWGKSPQVVDATNPDTTALHLQATDAIAHDAGATIASTFFGDPPQDWDGDRRPQDAAWDIGADEVAPATGGCAQDLARCQTDLQSCPSELVTCTDGLGACQSTLAGCQTSLTGTQATLTSCRTDLEDAQSASQACASDLAACRALPLLQDDDHDGVPDASDRCPGTAAGGLIDDSGCSPLQFCARFDATTTKGKQTCKKADWRNDEPLMKPAESNCVVDRGGRGTADDRCVPRGFP
jgi:hypothetical protein